MPISDYSFAPRVVFSCAVLAAVAPATAAEETVQFAPHRAVYEFSLAGTSTGSSVAGLTGRMVYELSGSACEGYTQNMRFVTRMSNQEGLDTLNDLRTSSWEEIAGKRLRFSASQYQNDDVSDASQGDAKRDKATEAVSVDLVKPGKKRISLPDGTYFPMQHANALITAAKGGQTLLTAKLYDGSEKGDKYYATTAIIGKKAEPGAVKTTVALKEAAKLAALTSWPMSISYFEPGKDKQDVPPAYELSFRYYENGVTADLKIDYGEFAIKGALKELSFLDASPCKPAAP
jgi:EipB-like